MPTGQLQTPLSRLPPEIRANIYQHLIRPRALHVRRVISGQPHGPPPHIFLVSKGFYAEAKDYLFNNHTFTVEVLGTTVKASSSRRRDSAADVAKRLDKIRYILLNVRSLHLQLPIEGHIVGSALTIFALLYWIKLILDGRSEPVQSLSVELFATRWRYTNLERGLREAGDLPDDGKGPLACDYVLDLIAQLRCLNLKWLDLDRKRFQRAVSDTAYDQLLRAYEERQGLPALDDSIAAQRALHVAEEDAVKSAITCSWRKASLVARLTNGEFEYFLYVYRFGDRDDKKAYARRLYRKALGCLGMKNSPD